MADPAPTEIPPEVMRQMMAPPPMPVSVATTIEMLQWRPSVEDIGHDENGNVVRAICAMAADNSTLVRLGGISVENAREIARLLVAEDENPPSAVATGKLVIPDGKIIVPGA